jgi:uncharacterized membrane protein
MFLLLLGTSTTMLLLLLGIRHRVAVALGSPTTLDELIVVPEHLNPRALFLGITTSGLHRLVSVNFCRCVSKSILIKRLLVSDSIEEDLVTIEGCLIVVLGAVVLV